MFKLTPLIQIRYTAPYIPTQSISKESAVMTRSFNYRYGGGAYHGTLTGDGSVRMFLDWFTRSAIAEIESTSYRY